MATALADSLALVRRAYQGELAIVHPDIEVHDRDSVGVPRVHRGHAAFLAWLGPSRADLEELVGVGGDSVVGFTHEIGRAPSGMAVGREDRLVWTVREGLVVRVVREAAA